MDFHFFFEKNRNLCVIIEKDGNIIAANQSARNYQIIPSENFFKKLLAHEADRAKISMEQIPITTAENQKSIQIEFSGFPELLLRSRWKVDKLENDCFALICEELSRFTAEDFLLHTGLMKTIFDNDPNLITITNRNGQLLFANKSVYEFAGLADNRQIELLNQLCLDSNIWLPGKEFSEQKRNTNDIELTTNLKGEPLWFENFRASIIMLFGEEVFLTISKDVTNWKTSEKKLLNYQQSLAYNTKLSYLGEMTGQVAHEINNPLAVILGNSQLLKESLSGANNPEQESLLLAIHRIESMVTRISKIIKMMRVLSNENVKTTTDCVVKVTDVLSGVISTLSDKLNAFEINIKHNYTLTKELYIACHLAEISQVYLNLFLNAIDAIAVNTNCKLRTIEINIKSEKEFVYVSIIDSGEGVAKEIQDRIFEPFFTTKQVALTTGLGLSISKKIIENHKGELYLESSEKNRTEFVVKLPLSD